MSNTPATQDDGLEVVVNEDGGVTIPASELARRGIHPGAHLRVVPEQRTGHQRRSARGMFSHLVKPGDMDAWEAAMAEAKAERIAAVLADPDQE